MYVEAIPRLDAAGHYADVLGMYLGLADIEVAQVRSATRSEPSRSASHTPGDTRAYAERPTCTSD